MYTLSDVEEIMERAINALDKTLGSRIDPLYMEELIHQVREEGIPMLYNGTRSIKANKRIDGSWVQHFDVDIISTDQPTGVDYLIFNIPAPITISYNKSGIQYIGAKKITKQFNVAQSRSEIADLIRRGYLKDGKDIAVLWERDQLLVWGNLQLKKISVSMIAKNPTEVPGYNDELSEYPVSGDLLSLMSQLIIQRVGVGLKQAPDIIADSADTNSLLVTKRNLAN